MFEVEMKFRLENIDAYEERLAKEFHVNLSAPQLEEDLYFQRDSRDFRETGEALRIRRIGSDLKVTYKGPRMDTVTKMREEIELPLFFPASETEGTESEFNLANHRKEDWTRLLGRLGYHPFATVSKKRKSGSLQFDGFPFTITCDRLAGVGNFTELETIAADKENLAAPRAALLALAARLGLKEYVKNSYLTLFLTSQNEKENP